ncbi:MAG: NADH-quinone oxidoreductase subunit N [Planctomycetia bacterium]|nr:NADH-quinone oxidoreductase subunit N [Planctomycetia bacterium]
MTTATSIQLLAPQCVLVFTAIVIFVGGAFSEGRGPWKQLGIFGLVMSGLILAQHQRAFETLLQHNEVAATFGPVSLDLLGYLASWLALGVGVLLVLQVTGTDARGPAPEVIGSLLLLVAGLMLAAQANDLVLLFLALELISIPTYVLLALARPTPAGREAALKYFFLSILSSGLTLYGFSFLYGVAGSTQLADLYSVAAGPLHAFTSLPLLVRLGVLLVVAGLGMKIAIVPLHFYAPDVYQGTSPAAAAMLSAVPKIAGVIVLVRVAAAARPDLGELGWKLMLGLSVITMTLGNVLALWQRNVRRLLAYSSIAHAGYLLIGLAVWLAVPDKSVAGSGHPVTPGLAVSGLSAALFYLVVYSVASLGTFAAIGYLGRPDRPLDTVSELAGVASSHPAIAAALALFMFSLAGLPPLAGFWGKLMLIIRALSVDVGPSAISPGVRHWFIVVSVIAVLNAAISAAYYLRIIGAMYFRPQHGAPAADGGLGTKLATGLAAVLVVGMSLYAGPALHGSDVAAESGAVPLPAAATPRARPAVAQNGQPSVAVPQLSAASR